MNGIILCGGKSSRMGKPKPLIDTGGGITVIETVIKALEPAVENILLINNDPETYLFLGLPQYEDIFPGKGPLAGIHTGLTHSSAEKNIIVAADMPLLNTEFFLFLAEKGSEGDIFLPYENGYRQYLCGVYSQSCKTEAERRLQSGGPFSLHRFIQSFDTVTFDAQKESFYEPGMFRSMNTPEDAALILGKLRNRR